MIKNSFYLLVFWIIFLSGCSNNITLSEYKILYETDTITVQNYNSELIGDNENIKEFSLSQTDLNKIVNLILASKYQGTLSSKEIISEDYICFAFNIKEGKSAGTYTMLYSQETKNILFPKKLGDELSSMSSFNINKELDKKLLDLIEEHLQLANNNTSQLKEPSFIIWMGAAKWADKDGRKKGIYEARLNNKDYRLYLLSLGEQVYGSQIEGSFDTNINSDKMIISLSLKPSPNKVPDLKSPTYLILRTYAWQNIEVKHVDQNKKTIGVLEHLMTDYYDEIMEIAINL